MMLGLVRRPAAASSRTQHTRTIEYTTQAVRWRRRPRKRGSGGGDGGGVGSDGGGDGDAAPLPPDDPVLQSFADAYGADPTSPPPIIAAVARAAAAERAAAAAPDDGAVRWGGTAGGELYQLRLGTAVALQALFQGASGGGGAASRRRRPPPPRDRAIKIVAAVCDEATRSILASYDYAELRDTLARAAAAVAADKARSSSSRTTSSSSKFDAWAAPMTRLYAPCLGSIEARRAYAESYAQPRPQAFRGAGGEPFEADLTRGWAAARALWQLALARALAELLGGPGRRAEILVADPCLTAFDRRVMAACGAKVVPPDCHPVAPGGGGGDEDGSSEDSGEGLFVFAPACPHAVNADILRASDAAGGLGPQLAYIGTCCEYYSELDTLRERQRSGQQRQVEAAAPSYVEDDDACADDDAFGCCCSGVNGCGSSSGDGDDDPFAWLAGLRRGGRAVELGLPSFGRLCDPSMRLHVFRR